MEQDGTGADTLCLKGSLVIPWMGVLHLSYGKSLGKISSCLFANALSIICVSTLKSNGASSTAGLFIFTF